MNSQRRLRPGSNWGNGDTGPSPDTFVKPIDGAESPVQSPVHRLQAELQRLETGRVQFDHAAVRKAPGWVQLVLPVAASSVLWAVIFVIWTLVA